MKTIVLSTIKGNIIKVLNILLEREKASGTYGDHFIIKDENVNGKTILKIYNKEGQHSPIPELRLTEKLSSIHGVKADKKPSADYITCSSSNDTVWVLDTPSPPQSNHGTGSTSNNGSTPSGIQGSEEEQKDFDAQFLTFKKLATENLDAMKALIGGVIAKGENLLKGDPPEKISHPDRVAQNILQELKNANMVIHCPKEDLPGAMRMPSREELAILIKKGLEKDTRQRKRRTAGNQSNSQGDNKVHSG